MSPILREDFVQEKREISVGVRSTRVQSLKRVNGRQTGIRAYNGRAISIAGGQGFPDCDKLWKEAVEGLHRGIEYPLLPQTDNKEEVSTQGSMLNDTQLLEEAEIILSRFRHRYPDIVLSGAFSSVQYSASLRNETGLDLNFSSPVFKCSFVFRHRNSPDSIDGYTDTYGVNYSREKVLQDLNIVIGPFLSAAYKGKSSKTPVILSMGHDNYLARELLKNMTCRGLQMGFSLFAGKMNRQVLNSKLTLKQCCDSSNTGLKFFDKEGTVNPGHSIDLIGGGVPLRAVTDRLTALQYGCENSGSAYRGSYDTVPSVGLPFVRFADTGKSLDEILGGREALFLVVPGGGGVSDNGRFSVTVQLGYMMKDGKATSRVTRGNVSGWLTDMFGSDYLGCSSDSILSMTHSPAVVCEMEMDPKGSNY